MQKNYQNKSKNAIIAIKNNTLRLCKQSKMDNKNLFVWKKQKKKKEKEPKRKKKKRKRKIYKKKKKAQSGDWECVFQYETF